MVSNCTLEGVHTDVFLFKVSLLPCLLLDCNAVVITGILMAICREAIVQVLKSCHPVTKQTKRTKKPLCVSHLAVQGTKINLAQIFLK